MSAQLNYYFKVLNMFFLESKEEFNGVSLDTYNNLIQSLTENIGLSDLKLVEAASFSMSMVIRVALGLDSKDAHVAIIINNSLASRIALACLRQLMNSGASGLIVAIEGADLNAEQLKSELKYHEHMQTEVFIWGKNANPKEVSELLENQDTIISGLFDENCPNTGEEISTNIFLLNEIETPIHSIIAPVGVNPDSGKRYEHALVSASTLSLGIPLKGLQIASDQVGRHYLCDVNYSKLLLTEKNISLPVIFNEQPVVQIFPKK